MGSITPLKLDDVQNFEYLKLDHRHLGGVDRFIETIFTDPQKILQVQDLDNRVRSLEKQTNRLWIGVGIGGGLLAVLITSVVTMALAS